jgi:hypothetical protein
VATAGQRQALQLLIAGISDAVRDSGPGGIPSGTVYAAVMHICDINLYNAIIQQMVEEKMLTSSNHLLVWTGPVPKTTDGEAPAEG